MYVVSISIRSYAHPYLYFQGHTYYDPVAGHSGVVGGKVSHKCSCKIRDLLVAFFIVMAILLAVASLVLSGLLWFGINGSTSESECSCPGEPPSLAIRFPYTLPSSSSFPFNFQDFPFPLPILCSLFTVSC